MVKSLNEHRNNIKPEVRIAAKAKAMGIVAKMSNAETKNAKERGRPAPAEKRIITQSDLSNK